MQTRTLEAIVAVADELHFGRAATRAGMPQPSLSQRIQRFERELGFPLFERDRRSVQITPAGEEVIARARRIVAGTEWIEQFARETRKGHGGELKIAAVGSSFFEALPKVLQQVKVNLPHTIFRIRELETSELLEALKVGSVDLGFARPPFPASYLSQTVWVEPLVVAINTQNALSESPLLDIRDLVNEKFVFFPGDTGTGYWDIVNQMYMTIGASFAPEEVSDHVTTILGLVSMNEGLSIVPQSASLPYPNVRYIPLTPKTHLPLDAVIDRRQTSPATVSAMHAMPHPLTTPIRPNGLN